MKNATNQTTIEQGRRLLAAGYPHVTLHMQPATTRSSPTRSPWGASGTSPTGTASSDPSRSSSSRPARWTAASHPKT